MMQLYDSTADKYDRRHENATTAYLRKAEKKILGKFCRGAVLDTGCGTGVYSDVAEDYVGIDPSGGMLKEARKKKEKIFILAKAEYMPFASQKFDTVICMFTVLNLCDVKKAVREMKRVLKEDGTLIISVASVWDRKSYGFFEKLMGKYDSDVKNVRIEKQRLQFHLFTKRELVRVFKTEGFRLRGFKGIFKWQEPYWNKYVEFGFFQKIKLMFDGMLPAKTARIFLAVFKEAKTTGK